jgi:hypothetical protein
MAATSIKEVFLDFKTEFDAEAARRVERGALHLVQEIRNKIKGVTKVSSGASGSLLSLTYNVKLEAFAVRAQIGISSAADYLKYRLFGVQPASDAFYPAHSKMPPVAKFRKWAQQSGLSVPTWAKDRADFNAEQLAKKRVPKVYLEKKGHPWWSADPMDVWAFAMARRRMLQGVEPLKENRSGAHMSGRPIIEAVFEDQRTRLEAILAGA